MAIECPHALTPLAPVRHRAALQALNDAGEAVFATLRLWRQRVRERQQLANLDDRMIRDIGITRADALYLGSKPFWRK